LRKGINVPKGKVLLIGAFHTSPVNELPMILKMLGYEVFKCGPTNKNFDDLVDLNLISVPTKVKGFIDNVFGCGRNLVSKIRELSLKSILSIIGKDFDFILHFQDWMFFNDIDKCSIPYIYVSSEFWYPWLPRIADHVFCQYQITKDVLDFHYPLVKKEIWYSGVISGLIVNNPFEVNRNIKVSFAGGMHQFDEIYQNRRDVMFYLRDNLDGDFVGHWDKVVEKDDKPEPEEGEGRLTGLKYKTLLANSKIGINASSGGANFRDLEVCGTGAMLLTNKTIDHERMGFKDNVNCRFYETKEEALEIINTISDKDILRIAKEGYNLVRKNWTYIKCISRLMKRIEELIK